MTAFLSTEDRAILTEQLGREPRGARSIEVRCPAGHPLVAKVYPILKNQDELTPFPTLFWLTCPEVVTQVSRLEANGWIRRLEQSIQDDPDLRQDLQDAHRTYIDERWNFLTPEDQASIQARGWETQYRNQGIGGIARFERLKCLHLHLAHHFARQNPMGRVLVEELRIRDCNTT
jgi:hypothetical protein